MNIFNKTIFWVTAIFISASIFRLTNMNLIEFKLDEARDVYEMEKFWNCHPERSEGSPTDVGISNELRDSSLIAQNDNCGFHFIQRGTIQSTGVYNPPLWYYILAVLSLPSRDPQYLSFMIGFINCVAVAGFYLVVRKFYGQRVGVASGLLMAFSPWMIIFSRKIWAPDLIFPFVVLWFYFINYLGWQPESTPRVSNSRWAWFGLVLTLMLLAQLHASGIFLAIASIIIIIVIKIIKVIKIKINFKFTLLGLVLSLIPLIPYLIYQLQNGCPDCQAYFAYQEGEALGAKPNFDTNAFIRPFQFLNGSGFKDVLGEEGLMQFLQKKPIVGIFNFLFLLEFLLLPVGAWNLILRPPGRSQSPPSRWPGWLMLAILITVPLLVFLTKTPAHLYYFLILSPIVILIYALGIFHPWGVSLDFARDRRVHPRGGPVLLVIIIAINIIFTFSFYRFLGEQGVVKGDYGATYKVLKGEAERRNMRVEEYVISLSL